MSVTNEMFTVNFMYRLVKTRLFFPAFFYKNKKMYL